MTTEHQGELSVMLDGVPPLVGPHRQGLTDEEALDAWAAEVEQAADEQEATLAAMDEGSE